MGQNRGKDFENKVREDLGLVEGVSVDRLPDQMNGFKGGTNICDFIVYKYPNIIFLECKSCYGNTLNFSNISQLDSLTKKVGIKGCIPGVMIWFIDHDLTLFVKAEGLQRLKDSGCKSVNAKTYNLNLYLDEYVVVPGKKRRIFFDYDMETFLKEVQS